MIALTAGALVCLALSRERSLWAGWFPALTMLAVMLMLAAGPLVSGWVVLFAAAALLVAGVLAARGHDRLMSIHRGISAIAMAALSITAVALPDAAAATGAAAPAPSHHMQMLGAGTVFVGLAVAVGAIGIAFAVRFALEHRTAGAGGTVGAASPALVNGGTPVLTRIRVARLAEVLLMTAGVAVMLVHT